MSHEPAPPLHNPNAAPPELLSPEFVPRSFGGEMCWAKGQAFEAKVLRVSAGQKVRVTGKQRQDMHVMLTGGRACLIQDGAKDDSEPLELEVARAMRIEHGMDYRLVALTDVELLSVYTPLPPRDDFGHRP